MKYRPVDENGDMMPITSMSQMKTGADAVALAADNRLAMMYGEWWENRDLGFKMWNILVATAKDGDAGIIASYISQYIARTEGCIGVSNVTVGVANRQMSYSCTLETEEGTAEMEVGENVLLGATY